MRSFLFFIILFFNLHLFCQRKVPADSIVDFAESFIGTKYKYANCEPKKGFDCSGFVYHVFHHFDIKVPRASMDYEKLGRKISIDSCRKGDVIVFTGTKPKNRKPGHVGIIVSEKGKEISFIHSSSGKKANGVIITNYTNSAYYQSRFIKVVRLDEVEYKNP